ncbi:MAG TPA: TIGR01777 family oxidoreductase [Chitinophagales bacterium]|nr:TIGR01777 family oxidoreductase [Chitinophagales bacterium]
MAKVLITGASGLVGTRLSELLKAQGHEVNKLGRTGKGRRKPGTFNWDLTTGKIDERAFEGVSAIAHLAGAGIADERWTNNRKKEIIDSRVKSAELLFNYLKTHKHTVKTIVSASAVGYYGDCGAEKVTEEHAPGDGFLADVCKQWEASVQQFAAIGIRPVMCRLGIVLSQDGGALPELTKTIPIGIAGYFAKDNLYYPWIHIDDVCGILIHAIETDAMSGAYNTTAPKPLLIKELMQKIVEAKKSNAILTPIPPLAIKLMLGEKSAVVLQSQRCVADKIVKSGYQFKYGKIENALGEIFKD